ncbi:tuberin, putative [Entamoeba invadens IP1]|uniref:Tuberin, putative n=1 Tax=Entamoeba invadens IP1 TaxID=370355 RepID=A0A0A1U563_ENTIV|nr:tuberin, putative [Entamoeba invadens IP1]ELP89429.1 tuberin, putative [Entamoeba invadens IP1]|eukprot:XP_004256200.1 tuberin, putative [Entamoeba invadens IP1]
MSKSKGGDIDKKLKKHRISILDSKTDPTTRQKSILFFLENKKESELMQLFKDNKPSLHHLFTLYPPILDSANKKQRILTEKDALIVQTLLELAADNYSPSEITFVEPLVSILTTFLAVETPFKMRKDVFQKFLMMITKLNATDEELPYLKLFIGVLNLECFSSDVTLHLTCTHLPVGVPTPQIIENPVESPKPKQQSFQLLEIFFTELIKNTEILYPFFKHILSYLVPNYCKAIFLDTYKQKTGFIANIPSDLLDFVLKTMCNFDLLKALAPYHEKLLELMTVLYDQCLTLNVIEYQMITRTVQSYLNNFIMNEVSVFLVGSVNAENLLVFQKSVITKISQLFIKNKENEEPEVKILIQNLVKSFTGCLEKQNYFSDDLKKEVVNTLAIGTIGFLPEKVGVQTVSLVTVVMNCLFIVWIYWNRYDIEGWKKLHQDLKPFLKNDLIISEVERKLFQITKELINQHYTLREAQIKSLPSQLEMMKVKNSNFVYLDVKENDKKELPEDKELKGYLTDFTTDDLLNLWNIFNGIFEDIDGLDPIAQVNCCHSLISIIQFLLDVDGRGETLDDVLEKGRIQMYEVYMPHLIKLIKTVDLGDEQHLLYKMLCNLMVRKVPKITNAVYNYFYEIIQNITCDNEKAVEDVLIGCSQIFTIGLPGAEVLIPKFLALLKSFKNVNFGGNEEVQIAFLISSTLDVCFNNSEILQYFTIEGDINEMITSVLSHVVEEFKSASGKIEIVWIIEKFIRHLVDTQMTQQRYINDVLDLVLNMITPKQSTTITDNIFNAIILLHQHLLPDQVVVSLVSTLLDKIEKKELDNAIVGGIFLTLSDLFSGERSVLAMDITIEFVQKMFNSFVVAMSMKNEQTNKMGGAEGAELFVETVMHHFGIFGNKGIDKISGKEETSTAEWFVLGDSRVMSISKEFIVTKIEETKESTEISDELLEELLEETPRTQLNVEKKTKVDIKENNKSLCRIIIRDALGRWVWDVEELWVESQLHGGSSSIVEDIKKANWEDLVLKLVEQKYKDTVFKNEGKIEEMLDTLKEQFSDFSWDNASEIYDVKTYEDDVVLFGNRVDQYKEMMNSLKIERNEVPERTKFTKNGSISSFVSSIIETNALPSFTKSVCPFEMTDRFKLAIRQIDKLPLRETHKVALYYVKDQQTLVESLTNVEPSKEYLVFEESLSWNIQSSTFEKPTDYYSTCRDEILFNSLWKAIQSNDIENIQEKQKHMFSSFVQVAFVEGNQKINIEALATQFTNVFIIIRPHKLGFRIEIYRNGNIPMFGPLIHGDIVAYENLPQLVRETALNASRAVHNALMGDSVLRPFVQRGKAIRDLISANKSINSNYFEVKQKIFFMNNNALENA